MLHPAMHLKSTDSSNGRCAWLSGNQEWLPQHKEKDAATLYAFVCYQQSLHLTSASGGGVNAVAQVLSIRSPSGAASTADLRLPWYCSRTLLGEGDRRRAEEGEEEEGRAELLHILSAAQVIGLTAYGSCLYDAPYLQR